MCGSVASNGSHMTDRLTTRDKATYVPIVKVVITESTILVVCQWIFAVVKSTYLAFRSVSSLGPLSESQTNLMDNCFSIHNSHSNIPSRDARLRRLLLRRVVCQSIRKIVGPRNIWFVLSKCHCEFDLMTKGHSFLPRHLLWCRQAQHQEYLQQCLPSHQRRTPH
jgi:hypothetical protein